MIFKESKAYGVNPGTTYHWSKNSDSNNDEA